MRNIFVFILISAFLFTGWYLFIKEYDYKFLFGANSGPASVYQEIKHLEKLGINDRQDQAVQLKAALPSSQLVQNVSFKDSSIRMEWNFKYENDSLTRIEVNTVDPQNKLKNRLEILNPFQKSRYVDDLAKKFAGIKQRLDAKQSTYIVRTKEITESPGFNCICAPSFNIPVRQKANEMLETIEIIESYFVKYNLKLKGYPFLKVTNWNFAEESIDFDFCFPVEVPKDLKETAHIKVKIYPGLPSLKAIFRGNYRESHLAWYELLEKGRREDILLDPKPLEVFFNNPRMGEDALSWKAEVFMPLANH